MAEKAVKPGKFSTEFYVTLAGMISAGVMMGTGVPVSPEAVLGAITVMGTAYTIIRGWLKSK